MRMTKHLHLDPFSGIAGDMFLAALIDLGATVEALERALAPLPIHDRFRLRVERVSSHGIGAVNLHVDEVQAAEDVGSHQASSGHHHVGHHHHHHHTTSRDIVAMIALMDAADRAKDRAERIVRKLAEAEARVHGIEPDRVHFHEVGAIDSIVDMLGAAVALEELDVATVSCGVLPISRGWVKCAHGLMPVPAPATAYLLEGLATQGVDREGELVTPTGAAIVAALTEETTPLPTPPPMRPIATGYGAGDRQYPDYPNLLRVTLGNRLSPGDLGPTTPDVI